MQFTKQSHIRLKNGVEIPRLGLGVYIKISCERLHINIEHTFSDDSINKCQKSIC
jgi:hypothetical protein